MLNIAINICFTLPCYAGIMLNPFNDPLYSRLCFHNRRVPRHNFENYRLATNFLSIANSGNYGAPSSITLDVHRHDSTIIGSYIISKYEISDSDVGDDAV